MTSYFIFILFFFLQKTYCYDCTYPNSLDCNNHGKCTRSGTCLCDLYYYGVKCENGIKKTQIFSILLKKNIKVINETHRVHIIETGISQGDLAGIIIGWMFGIFFLIGLVKPPIFYKIMLIISLNLVDLHFLLLR